MGLKRLLSMGLAVPISVTSALVVGISSATLAAAPPGPYFNGFEQNTAGWLDGLDKKIVRRASGWVPTSESEYADGVSSAAGQWHARFEDNGTLCIQNCDGPFTRWGGYTSTFPPGGYRTQIDIYFDVEWAKTHPDVRFDWSSAINTSQSTGICANSGNPPPCHRRDFVFNVSTKMVPTDPDGFRIQSSTNAGRGGANPNFPCPDPSTPPNNSCRPPAFITTSGWYTFRHTFRDDGSGFLAVDFDIFPLGSTLALAHWTIDGNRPTDSDPMSDVGGNRYGWFANEEVPDLAIDNSLRTGLCRNGGGDGDVEDKNSGKHGHMHVNGNGCEGGQQGGDVEENDQNSGDNFQSNNTSSTTFTSGEDSQTMTMAGTGVHNGLPVAFTMVAVDNGTLAPALFSLVLSDGYAIIGSLTSGSVSIP